MSVEQQILASLQQMNSTLQAQVQSSSQMLQSLARAAGMTRAEGNLRPGELERHMGGEPRIPKRDKSADSYDNLRGKIRKTSGQLFSDMSDVRDALDELGDVFTEAKKNYGEVNENIVMFSKGLGKLSQQANRLVKGMSRFDSQIAKNMKAQSLLYSEQMRVYSHFKDFEFSAYVETLSDAVDLLDTETKKTLGVLDEVSNKLRTDLTIDDFAKIRKSIGEMLPSIHQTLADAGLTSLDDVINNPDMLKKADDATTSSIQNSPDSLKIDAAKADKAREAIVKLAQEMTLRGLYKPKDDRMNVLDGDGKLKALLSDAEINYVGLAKELKIVSDTFGKSANALDKAVTRFTHPATRLADSLQSVEGIQALGGVWGDWLKYGGMMTKGAALLTASLLALKRAAREASEYNIAQVPQGFIQSQWESIKTFGMSFEETVKILQENKRLLAVYGPGEFNNAVDGMQEAFREFGYTAKQSAELIGPTVQGAIQSGINVRDPDQLASYTNLMMESFQSIAGVIDISAKEFFELNAQLLKADGTFETLVGMDKQRRAAYADDLIQARSRYILGGLEKDQAQKLIEIQQQQMRDSIKNRMGDAAKAMALAQASGMGTDASMRIFSLMRKGVRTGEENTELTKLMGNLGQTMERNRVSESDRNGGDVWFTDALRESLQLGSAANEMIRAGSQMNIAGETGALTTGTENKAAAEAAKGSKSVAFIGDVANTVSSILSNSLLVALGTAVAGLVAFTVGGGFATLSLTALSGAANAASIALGGGKLGGMFGKLSTVLTTASSKLEGPLGKLRTVFSTGAGSVGGMFGRLTSVFSSGTVTVSGVFGKLSSALASGSGLMGGLFGKLATVLSSGTSALMASLSGMAGSIMSSAASLGKFALGNAGTLTSIAAIGTLAYNAWNGINETEEKERSGAISEKEAITEKAGMLGMLAGGGSAAVIGAGIGSVLLPGIGTFVGGALGAAIGGAIGKYGTEAVVDAGQTVFETKQENENLNSLTAFDQFGNVFSSGSNLISGVFDQFGNVFSSGSNLISGAFDQFGNVFSSGTDLFGNFFGSGVNSVLDKFGSTFTSGGLTRSIPGQVEKNAADSTAPAKPSSKEKSTSISVGEKTGQHVENVWLDSALRESLLKYTTAPGTLVKNAQETMTDNLVGTPTNKISRSITTENILGAQVDKISEIQSIAGTPVANTQAVSVPGSDINTPAGEGINTGVLNVMDPESIQHTSLLQQAVDLLTKILEKDAGIPTVAKEEEKPNRRMAPIPEQYTFYTGKTRF